MLTPITVHDEHGNPAVFWFTPSALETLHESLSTQTPLARPVIAEHFDLYEAHTEERLLTLTNTWGDTYSTHISDAELVRMESATQRDDRRGRAGVISYMYEALRLADLSGQTDLADGLRALLA